MLKCKNFSTVFVFVNDDLKGCHHCVIVLFIILNFQLVFNRTVGLKDDSVKKYKRKQRIHKRDFLYLMSYYLY